MKVDRIMLIRTNGYTLKDKVFPNDPMLPHHCGIKGNPVVISDSYGNGQVLYGRSYAMYTGRVQVMAFRPCDLKAVPKEAWGI